MSKRGSSIYANSLTLGDEGEVYFATLKCTVDGKRRVYLVLVRTGKYGFGGSEMYAFPSRSRCNLRDTCNGLQKASDFVHNLLCKLGFGNVVTKESVKKHKIATYKNTKIYHIGFDGGVKYKPCGNTNGLVLIPTKGTVVTDKLLSSEQSGTYKVVNAVLNQNKAFFAKRGDEVLTNVTPNEV